jgi:hypothetical protein
MALDSPVTNYHRSEILALCQDCPDLDGKNCIITDIEASKEEYIDIPACATYATKKGPVIDETELSTSGEPSSFVNSLNSNNLFTIEDNLFTNENLFTPTKSKQGSEQSCSPTNEKTCSPIRGETETSEISLDSLDQKIISLVAQNAHARSIAKTLKRPQSTIQLRLHRLEKHQLIIPYKGVYGTKLYQVSARLNHLLIHNETTPFVTPFTAHSMAFKFQILEGDQPRSPRAQKMKNWMSYIFKFPDHTIRTTPRSVIVFINQDLGAASIDDLNLKYSQLAQSYAYKFAEKYHITLGSISKYRDPHFTLEDNPLARIIAERGEVHTTSGLFIDKSRSSGDLEMKEETARAMEFTLNKLPFMTAGFQSKLQEVKQTVDESASRLEEGMENIQKWLYLEKENRMLRDIIEQQNEQIDLLSKQADLPSSDKQKTPKKDTEGSMYG